MKYLIIIFFLFGCSTGNEKPEFKSDPLESIISNEIEFEQFLYVRGRGLMIYKINGMDPEGSKLVYTLKKQQIPRMFSISPGGILFLRDTSNMKEGKYKIKIRITEVTRDRLFSEKDLIIKIKKKKLKNNY